MAWGCVKDMQSSLRIKEFEVHGSGSFHSSSRPQLPSTNSTVTIVLQLPPFSYYFPFIFGFSIIPIYANFSAFNSWHIFFHLFSHFLGNLLTHPDTPANSWKRLKFSSCFVIHQKYLVLRFHFWRDVDSRCYGRLMPQKGTTRASPRYVLLRQAYLHVMFTC